VEGQGFRDGIQEFEKKNAAILGISFDTIKENRAFHRKFDFGYPLLCDSDRRIGLDYHAAADPDQAIADRITYVIDGDGTIAAAYATVDPKSHPAEILASL
jgi:peroxiredoxin Q/BCP